MVPTHCLDSDRIPPDSLPTRSDDLWLKQKPIATLLPFISSNKFVGERVDGPIRTTLRKKFSWKSYQKLETYLVKNRPQYMQYSSQLNYIAEQKRYNNTLTQGLLDFAAREGYCFEGFTFPAVRD